MRGATTALLLLTGVNLFNYIDRYVVSAVVESLKADRDLALTDAQAGSLMTGLIVVYALTSPFFGTLGDRGSRPRLIAAGVALWSIATAGAGLARSFVALFAARAAVGVGEAAYGTIGPAVLADFFPRSQRGRVFAFFFAAIPIGSALGYVIGGAVDERWGWRAAFFVAGLPGLALAALVLILRDPPRGAQDEGEDEGKLGHGPGRGAEGAYRALLRNRPYVLTVLGYAAYTWALGGLAFWMPAFLERIRAIPKSEATVTFGAIVVVTGFVGTFAGGWIGDWLLRHAKQAYLWLSGVATLAAVPLAWVALTHPSPPVYLAAIAAAEVLLFASTGPINSVIVNVVAPEIRATAVAVSIFAIHFLGDAISPAMIGAVSDHSSLARAVLLVPAAIAIAGAIWTYAAATARPRP